MLCYILLKQKPIIQVVLNLVFALTFCYTGLRVEVGYMRPGVSKAMGKWKFINLLILNTTEYHLLRHSLANRLTQTS